MSVNERRGLYFAKDRYGSGRPPNPGSLDDDATEYFRRDSGLPDSSGTDDETTQIGSRAGKYVERDDEKTQMGGRHGGAYDDETIIPRKSKDIGIIGLLVVKSGMRRGGVFKLREETVIGREDAAIVLRDQSVSRTHAKINLENDQFTIWDFGSKGGTFVNDQQIRAATSLKENDIIKIGETEFVLKIVK